MTETLTESFCERCGTRYEFSAPTRLNPLRKTRGLIGGLKNYLTSQDALSDAVGDALRGEEGALATAQLEAFHEAFNFCIDCRQYTCLNCWNDDAGRCRSCAPIAGTDDLVERLAASAVAEQPGMIAEALMSDEDVQRRVGQDAWPTSDLPTVAATNGHLEEPWPVTQEIATPVAPPSPDGYIGADGFVYETQERAEAVAAQLAAQAEPEPEPIVAEAEPIAAQAEADSEPTWAAAELETDAVAAETQPEPEPEPVAAEVVAEVEPALPPLRVVAWDEDAAFDLEPEPVVAEVEPEPAPEPAVAGPQPEPMPEPAVAEAEPDLQPIGTTAKLWPEPEPVVAEAAEPEPEPVVAEAEPEPEPEPVAAEAVPEPEPVDLPRIAPISETILRFPERQAPPAQVPEPAAAVDESPEVAARRAQLDMLGLGGDETPEQSPAVLPYRSRGASVTPAELAAMAAAGATFWEASAREVAGAVGNVGLQNCGQCGLSLSASARFCRRCGTRQARSA